MNPEPVNLDGEKQKHPIFTVTPLSKYLALIIFVTMPFIGGYIGYIYGPEKVVYIDRVVPTVVENSGEEVSQPTKLSDILNERMKIGDMTLIEYSPYDPEYSEIDFNNVRMLLKGPIEVTGNFEYVEYEIGFEGYCMKDFSEETLAKLPYIPTSTGSPEPRASFCFRNEEDVFQKLGREAKTVTVLIDNYQLEAFPSEVVDRADLISVVE